MMKVTSFLLALGFGIAAASAQVIPYFPPFISALPSGRDAAVAHKFSHDRRFSVPAMQGAFIRNVIQRAKAEGRTVRTARTFLNGTEFVEIHVSERK